MVINNQLDRWPPQTDNPNNQLVLFMQRFNLKDFWREKYQTDSVFTWSNKNGSRQSRIDYWLVSDCLNSEDINIDILPTPLTDHKAIYISIKLSKHKVQNQKAYWILNNSLLKLNTVQQKISETVSHYFEKAKTENCYNTNWELFKYEIAKYLRRFSSDLNKSKKAEEEKNYS